MKKKRPSAAAFSFQALGEGRFAIGGTFGFATVTTILERSRKLFENEPVIRVDLSAVTQADSAGLALLLEWINWALHYQREVHLRSIPEQVLAIARIGEVEELLHSAERTGGGAASEGSKPSAS